MEKENSLFVVSNVFKIEWKKKTKVCIEKKKKKKTEAKMEWKISNKLKVSRVQLTEQIVKI